MNEIMSELMMNFRTSTVARVFTLVDRLVNSARRCTSRRRRVILLPRAVQIRSTWPRLRWIGFPDYGDPSGHPRINPYREGRKRRMERGERGKSSDSDRTESETWYPPPTLVVDTDFLLREQQFTKRNRTLAFPDLVTRTHPVHTFEFPKHGRVKCNSRRCSGNVYIYLENSICGLEKKRKIYL